MKVCPRCGTENSEDRDFCQCGEYLRWDPTRIVPAITREDFDSALLERPDADAPGAGAATPRRPAADGVVVTLRAPDTDGPPGEAPTVAVEPGGRTRLLALVRNQSGVVDNYDLSVRGVP